MLVEAHLDGGVARACAQQLDRQLGRVGGRGSQVVDAEDARWEFGLCELGLGGAQQNRRDDAAVRSSERSVPVGVQRGGVLAVTVGVDVCHAVEAGSRCAVHASSLQA